MAELPLWPLGDDPADWPTVSVVMPIRNESAHLRDAVDAVLSQEYPRPFDVCLAVAPSDDDTEAIAHDLAHGSDRVSVVPNPAGVTPAGLNAAIRATSGEVVVRVDGHARLSEGYIRRAVETMARTGAVNVGGIQDAVGETPFEQAVAAAMSSAFGTGGARFHLGGHEGPVDTVYLGVFHRDALERVGVFDDNLVRNQDYELNIRLREAGGVVWFDPELRVAYRPRGSVRELARQYFEYGWWKAVVAAAYPTSLRARQLAPAATTAAVGLGLVARNRLLRLAPIGYVFATTVAASMRTREAPALATRLLVVYPLMHLCWGAGFLASAASSPWRRRTRPT